MDVRHGLAELLLDSNPEGVRRHRTIIARSYKPYTDTTGFTVEGNKLNITAVCADGRTNLVQYRFDLLRRINFGEGTQLRILS